MALQLPWVPSGGTACCCPSPDCCLYPWPDPDNPDGALYPATDLPDTIVLHTSEFSSFDPSTAITLTRSGYEFSGTGPSGHNYVIAPGPTGWSNGDEFALFSFPCLIIADPSDPELPWIADEFADTYSADFSGFGFGSVLLTRVSLCAWESDLYPACTNDGPQVRIDYLQPAAWTMTAFVPDGEDPVHCQFVSALKIAPESSPAGDYDTDSGFITVSL